MRDRSGGETKKRRGEESSRCGEKRARGRSTRAPEKDRRRVRHVGRYTSTYVARLHAPTRGSVPRHMERVRARSLASLAPFKNPRSYRVSVPLYHSPPLCPLRPVAPRAFPTLKDVTSCNADQRGGRERAKRSRGRRSRLQQPRGSLLDRNSIKA